MSANTKPVVTLWRVIAGLVFAAGAVAGIRSAPGSSGASKNVATSTVSLVSDGLYAVCTWPCPRSTNAVPFG